jgi:hypothetical protein
LFFVESLTQLPCTLRPAAENFTGETLRFETVGVGTFGAGTTTVWVVTAAAFPLQYTVWPVNTVAVEQPELSVTLNETV